MKAVSSSGIWEYDSNDIKEIKTESFYGYDEEWHRIEGEEFDVVAYFKREGWFSVVLGTYSTETEAEEEIRNYSEALRRNKEKYQFRKGIA